MSEWIYSKPVHMSKKSISVEMIKNPFPGGISNECIKGQSQWKLRTMEGSLRLFNGTVRSFSLDVASGFWKGNAYSALGVHSRVCRSKMRMGAFCQTSSS